MKGRSGDTARFTPPRGPQPVTRKSVRKKAADFRLRQDYGGQGRPPLLGDSPNYESRATNSGTIRPFADSGNQGLGSGVGRPLGDGLVRGVGVGRGVDVAVGVAVGVVVGVAVGVALGVTVGVTLGVEVGVAVAVGVGVGVPPPVGETRT